MQKLETIVSSQNSQIKLLGKLALKKYRYEFKTVYGGESNNYL